MATENRKKVVLVDNNQDSLDSMTWFLESEGFVVVQLLTSSGKAEVSNQVIQENPSLVITGDRNENDLDDHDHSGRDLAIALKDAGILTILLTVNETSREVAQSENIPTMSKSDGADEILSEVKRLLRS